MANDLNWLERLTLGLYSCIVWLLQPLVRRKLLRRARQEPEYGRRIAERFGRYANAPSAGWLWVHAVSLGETRAACALIEQFRSQQPAMKLLLTHGTASGWAAGRALLAPGDRQTWFPWDTADATERFLLHFKPRVGLLLETEVWPNMVQSCLRHGVPLFLVNARLSDDSYMRANRLRCLSEPAYRSMAGAFAQSSADAKHLKALGAKVPGVVGNIKFDAQPAADQLAAGRAWRRRIGQPVLMLVSSRDGEEAAFVAVLSSGRAGHGYGFSSERCQILVVPRHNQRVAEVARLFRQAGFSVSRRSEWQGQPQPADVWLGDTMGELALYYAMSDVALLGGSFEPFGGQNLIEAAACGCPLVMGPHTFNFTEAAKWALDAGAARSASDMRAAVAQAFRWIDQPEQLEATRARCRQFASAHQGASRTTAEAVLGLLTAPGQRLPKAPRHVAVGQATDNAPSVSKQAAHRAGVS